MRTIRRKLFKALIELMNWFPYLYNIPAEWMIALLPTYQVKTCDCNRAIPSIPDPHICKNHPKETQ